MPQTLLGAEGFQSSPSATAQRRLVSGLTQQLEGAEGFPASAELPTEMQSSAFRGSGDFWLLGKEKSGRAFLK